MSSFLIFIHVAIQHVILSWIIDNNNHLKFEIEHHCARWMQNGPWYNTMIFYQLSCHNYEYFFKKGRKYRYELMCDVDVYYIIHPSVPDNGSSGGGILFPIR